MPFSNIQFESKINANLFIPSMSQSFIREREREGEYKYIQWARLDWASLSTFPQQKDLG